ncbi:MAG: hypothetical protein KatS3mg087_0287 [Patescibacteria group bacterium]|nr:MAG: hypothetical protein KatS3mg087_0287 [Patescibacteria group bacterium]
MTLGDPERFKTLGELIEAIAQHIYYYNNERIHSVLKMSPVQFRKEYQEKIVLKTKLVHVSEKRDLDSGFLSCVVHYLLFKLF